MKVLVCGSRSWDDYDTLFNRLSQLPQHTQIIHGGARGADAWADFAANNLFDPSPEVFKPLWDVYGKRAGFIRNSIMLDQNPDLVIAFWDGQSRGTAHTIKEAKRRGIPVEIVSSPMCYT